MALEAHALEHAARLFPVAHGTSGAADDVEYLGVHHRPAMESEHQPGAVDPSSGRLPSYPRNGREHRRATRAETVLGG
mgnify:CR=1 FL=1